MSLFNTTLGQFQISENLVLKKDMSVADVRGLGLTFIREYRTVYGDLHCGIGYHLFENHRAYVGLFFKSDALAKVTFGFAETDGQDARSQFELYADILKQHLGSSDDSGAAHMNHKYIYSWGTISIAYDYHNLTCAIYFSWSPE